MMSRAPLARDERHSSRTAKSCGPDARNAGVKSSRGQRLSGAMVARGSDSPGRARISRQAIAQGRPECSRFTCMLVCAVLCASMHTRPRVQRAPGLPCALWFLGADDLQTSGGVCRENAESYLVVPAHAGTHTARIRVLGSGVDAFFKHRDARGDGSPRAR